MQLEEHTDIDLLITRYLSGKMDKESFAELKRWSLESESNRKYVRNKLEVWFSSGVADTAVQFDKDKAFSLFKQRIVGAEKKQKQMFRFSWKTFMRAAAVVLILMIPFAAYWQGKQAVKQSFADMVVEAPMGAHTKLYLPDGTLVWLNAGSKIIYSQGFGVDDRRLRLEGEGNVKVEVADSLRNKRFYGSFGISGNTIDKILDVMASTQQMNYKYENGVYILY